MTIIFSSLLFLLTLNASFNIVWNERAKGQPRVQQIVNPANGFITKLDTIKNPFQKFVGEWVMKDGIFETNFSGAYSKNIGPQRFLVAQTPTNNSLLFNYDLGDATGVIFWTFDPIMKKVYHLSTNSIHPMAKGEGIIDSNGDLALKLFYEGNCKDCSSQCGTCYRIYSYKFISEDEIFFRATYYKDEKATGDYYGGTLIKKPKP